MTPEEVTKIENRLKALLVAANAKRHDGQPYHIRGLAAQTDGEVRRLLNEKPESPWVRLREKFRKN